MRTRQLTAYAPRSLTLEEFDLPDVPDPGHVLTETTCTLISTGTELANWVGNTTQRRPLGQDWRAQPYRPGYSSVGRVVAVGAGVDGVRVGDRVSGQGNHASAAVLDASRVAVVPDAVTDERAAFATLLMITMNAVRLARIELGDRVASVGLGLIGNLALQLARICGATPVAGTDLLAQRRAYAEAMHLHAVDPAASDFQEQVAALTGGKRFDVVFESTGSPAGLSPALKLAGRHARVVALGSTRGLVEQFDLYGDIHLPGISLIGAHMMTAPEHANFSNRWTALANRKVGLQLLAEGRLDVESLVSHRATPEQAADLFALLADRREEAMGVLLNWT